MRQRTQFNVYSAIGPMKMLLVLATAVCLLSALAGWVTGLPVPTALAVAEDAAPRSTPAASDTPNALAMPEPTAEPSTARPSAPVTRSNSLQPVLAETAPATRASVVVTPTSTVSYTVQAGDTLGTIARAYGVSLEDLLAANDLDDPNLLYAGQALVVPRDSASPSPSPTATPLPAQPTPIPAPAVVSAVNETRWIDVDVSQQSLTAYEGSTPVRTTLVSTGLPATPTPVGQFRIWIKLRYDDMAGPGYYISDVPYVMYFHQGYGLHGVTWHGNFGHQMSHGCVNLPTEEAEWLFNWAEIGTLVNIHE